MRRLGRWSLVVVSLSIVSLAAGLVSVAWNDRAEAICREEAESSFTVGWDWNELAYVCDYGSPVEPSRRVGVVDAFHGDGRQRHRP